MLIWGWLAVSLVVISGWIVWAINSTELARLWFHVDQNAMSQWGESFVAFNTLVSGLGFVAIMFTLIHQCRSFRKQQLELHRQKFDDVFFRLLQLMRETRDQVRFQYSSEFANKKRKGDPITMQIGHDALTCSVRELYYWIAISRKSGCPMTKEVLCSIYIKRIHERYESRFGPYFRILYFILDMLRKDNTILEEDKIRYANLVRGQLTSYEILLWSVNALAPFANDLMTLIVMFHMLKYMRPGATRNILEKIYPADAFAGRD